MIMQINVARSKLSRFPSKELAKTMGALLDQYEDEGLGGDRRVWTLGD